MTSGIKRMTRTSRFIRGHALCLGCNTGYSLQSTFATLLIFQFSKDLCKFPSSWMGRANVGSSVYSKNHSVPQS